MRTHITSHARTRPYTPLRGPGPHPLVLPRFTSSKDAESRGKGRRWRERKDVLFFPGPPVWRRQQVCITTKEWKSWKSVSRQVLEWHLNSKHSRDHPRRIFCICKHKLPPKSKWGKQRDSCQSQRLLTQQ